MITIIDSVGDQPNQPDDRLLVALRDAAGVLTDPERADRAARDRARAIIEVALERFEGVSP